jgi:hypothetical protein
MSSSLCDAFTKASIDTWHRIQEGRALRYPLGEETLTDLLLRDLLRLHLPDITIEAFTKKAEGKNGADWEWWFQGFTGNWLGLRVQAKVIAHDADEFKHLHYYKQKGTPPQRNYQCDKLINKAAANPQWPCVPVYCLYSYWTAAYTVPTGYCCWGLRPGASSFGCSIVPATDVRALRAADSTGRDFRSLVTDTLDYSLPLACLVCCPFGPGTESVAERMHALLNDMGALQPGLDYLRPTPPPYVQQLTRERRNQSAVRPGGDLNFRSDIQLPPSLAGVVAIQQAPL